MRRIITGGLIAAATIAVAAGGALAKGDPARGKATFEQICAPCHGATGKGDGPASSALNPKPRNFTDTQYMSGLTDDYIMKIVKQGGQAVGKSPMMPAMGATLKEADIENVIAYVRSLAK